MHMHAYICIHMRTYTMYPRQRNNTQGVHTLYAFEILRNDSVVGKKENEVKRWVIKKRFSHFKVFDKILQQVLKIELGPNQLGAQIRAVKHFEKRFRHFKVFFTRFFSVLCLACVWVCVCVCVVSVC